MPTSHCTVQAERRADSFKERSDTPRVFEHLDPDQQYRVFETLMPNKEVLSGEGMATIARIWFLFRVYTGVQSEVIHCPLQLGISTRGLCVQVTLGLRFIRSALRPSPMMDQQSTSLCKRVGIWDSMITSTMLHTSPLIPTPLSIHPSPQAPTATSVGNHLWSLQNSFRLLSPYRSLVSFALLAISVPCNFSTLSLVTWKGFGRGG
jgi:hypothetical protein